MEDVLVQHLQPEALFTIQFTDIGNQTHDVTLVDYVQS